LVMTIPKVKDGTVVQQVEAEHVRTAVDENWLRTQDALPVQPTQVDPDITTAEAEDMADGFAEDAVSKKRENKAEPGEDADSDVDGGVLTVSPKTIAKTLTFEDR